MNYNETERARWGGPSPWAGRDSRTGAQKRHEQRSLWLHLVSIHADPMAVSRSDDDNNDQHEHEHNGPGTIRHHPVGDLHYNEVAAKAVLKEMIDNP
jgi:hypothetical protein